MIDDPLYSITLHATLTAKAPDPATAVNLVLAQLEPLGLVDPGSRAWVEAPNGDDTEHLLIAGPSAGWSAKGGLSHARSQGRPSRG